MAWTDFDMQSVLQKISPHFLNDRSIAIKFIAAGAIMKKRYSIFQKKVSSMQGCWFDFEVSSRRKSRVNLKMWGKRKVQIFSS